MLLFQKAGQVKGYLKLNKKKTQISVMGNIFTLKIWNFEESSVLLVVII